MAIPTLQIAVQNWMCFHTKAGAGVDLAAIRRVVAAAAAGDEAKLKWFPNKSFITQNDLYQ